MEQDNRRSEVDVIHPMEVIALERDGREYHVNRVGRDYEVNGLGRDYAYLRALYRIDHHPREREFAVLSTVGEYLTALDLTVNSSQWASTTGITA